MNNFNTRTNEIYSIIKNFEYWFPEEFKKCDIIRCGHCNGTGLKDKNTEAGYCVYCGGIGYKGFKKLNNQFVCRTCNGGGCNLCDHRGIIDWISHARGADIARKAMVY